MLSLPKTRSFVLGMVIAAAMTAGAQQTTKAVLTDDGSQATVSQTTRTQARPTLTPVLSSRPAVQTFHGTIRRNMDGFVLRDSTGVTYDLDDQTRIRAFDGQNVKLKGRVNTTTGSIRVVAIEPAY